MSDNSAAAVRCPLCKKPAKRDFAPFCSRACKDKDLLTWLGEGYRIPEREGEDELQKSSDYGVDNSGDGAL